MSFRNIVVSNAGRLSVKNEQLVINQGDDYNVPLEDISSLVIENLSTNITGYALSKFADYNIGVFTCNNKHIPNGVLLSFNNHSRQLKVLNTQLNLSKPFKKRVWQNIIRQKIENQAICLKYLNKDGYDYLYGLISKVESGDKKNVESIAARAYFGNLFGDGFGRRYENATNAALNYGYSIIRGAVARAITAYGFQPSMGIKHHGELNTFNLADDFIEPYRAIVDLWVGHNMVKADDFETNQKISLYNLLNYNMLINNEKHSVLNCIDKTIKSFSTACQNEESNLVALPKLIKLQYHEYE